MHPYRYYLTLFFIGTSYFSQAQNLIKNGSFEEHGEQKCLSCNTGYGQYPSLVYNWDNGGWGCWLCDKNYKQDSDDKKYGLCPFEKLSPREGKAMIAMDYSPSTNVNYGSASSLSAHTTQPMLVGHLYEASFWLYIENTPRADPDWAKHIGIALLPQNVRYHGLYGKKLLIPFLCIDSVRYDAWYEVKWRIRPLCASNYLVIRVFADNIWPVSKGYAKTTYYVDNVVLTEIQTESIVADSSIYYCSRYDPKILGVTPKMDNEILLFQNDAYALTDAHKTILDSFAVFARKFPDLVFEISGHTDSIGRQNQQLSENRAQSVLQYLTETCKLPEFRFIPLAMGSKEPFRPNSTEDGRILNRRAEIRQSRLDLSNVFYRNALKAVQEKRYPEAFSCLDKWLFKLNKLYGSGIIMEFDPRFEVLQKDKRWGMLDQKIRSKYSKLKYAGYAYMLDSLCYDAQSATAELTNWGYLKGLNALSGYHPELDSVLFEMSPMEDAIIEKKRDQHFAALLSLLAKTGWPKKSEFGEGACGAAFSMLLNSNNVVECLKWLPVIQKSCDAGETPWIYYASLYDHCNLALGKPQRYLTHEGSLEKGNWEGDVNSINEWRAKIGLPGLSFKVVEAIENR